MTRAATAKDRLLAQKKSSHSIMQDVVLDSDDNVFFSDGYISSDQGTDCESLATSSTIDFASENAQLPSRESRGAEEGSSAFELEMVPVAHEQPPNHRESRILVIRPQGKGGKGKGKGRGRGGRGISSSGRRRSSQPARRPRRGIDDESPSNREPLAMQSRSPVSSASSSDESEIESDGE